ELHEYTITPEQVALTRVTQTEAFQGGDPADITEMLRTMLSTFTAKPATDMLCLNAGAALLANEQVTSLKEGIKLARATLQEGKAKQKLEDVIACSRALSS